MGVLFVGVVSDRENPRIYYRCLRTSTHYRFI